jgi:hypothetical protein
MDCYQKLKVVDLNKMKNNLIKINLNQTVSKFELAEIKHEQNRWYIFVSIGATFIMILLFNYFILSQYHNLISDRLESANSLTNDAKVIRKNYEKYNVGNIDLSISQDDIDRLYLVENRRVSLAAKLEKLAYDIPNSMSLEDLEYSYSKNGRRVIILTLLSESDQDTYNKNIKELIENISMNFCSDGDFKSVDHEKILDEYKGQTFYRVLFTIE